MVRYVALIRKSDPDGFRVDFPDFPNCMVTAATLEDARETAILALTAHVKDLGADGAPLPEPTGLDAVMGASDNREAIIFLVPAPSMRIHEVQVSVTLPEGMLARIDDFARQHNTDRSAFLARAAVHAMRETRRPA